MGGGLEFEVGGMGRGKEGGGEKRDVRGGIWVEWW